MSRENGAAGLPGASDSGVGSISGDGRFVAFTSIANNLSDHDANGTLDVFVRDLQAGTTNLASRAAGPDGAAGTDHSLGGPLSGDGRLIAFTSVADNLSDVDADGTYDVFVRELLGTPPTGGPAQAAPPPQPTDTTGPAIRARALSRGNGTIRVSSTGRFQLFCGRYSEPVTGSCKARSTRPIATALVGGRVLRLPARPFSVPAGRRVQLQSRLTSRGLNALRAARRARMRGTVIARDRPGNRTAVTFRFTLRAPRTATKRRG